VPERSHTRPPSRQFSRFWRINLLIIAALLALWAATTFIPAFFAASWIFSFLGWPFSYWMGAYGAPLAYLLIVAIYAWAMHVIERRAPADENTR
jgi:putative solute:sodium symporter small subunit